MNLKNLLKGTRETSANTTYLQRAAFSNFTPAEEDKEDNEEKETGEGMSAAGQESTEPEKSSTAEAVAAVVDAPLVDAIEAD